MGKTTIITFDGPDGVGKSTLVDNLYTFLCENEKPLLNQFGDNKYPVEIKKFKFPQEYPSKEAYKSPKELCKHYVEEFRDWKDKHLNRTKEHKIFLLDRSHLSTLAYNCFYTPGERSFAPSSKIKTKTILPIDKKTLKYDKAFDYVKKSFHKIFSDNAYGVDEACHVLVDQHTGKLVNFEGDGSKDITDQLSKEKAQKRLKTLQHIFQNKLSNFFDVGIKTSYVENSMYNRRVETNFYWKDPFVILRELLNKSEVLYRNFLRLRHKP